MAGFADALGMEDIEAIRAFLVAQANGLRDWQEERRDDRESEAENSG